MFCCCLCSSITPDNWQLISNDNIAKAEQERIASTTLRGVVSSILDQTQQDVLKQRKIVNLAFNKRIQEMTQAKEKLEEHLQEVRIVIMHTRLMRIIIIINVYMYTEMCTHCNTYHY